MKHARAGLYLLTTLVMYLGLPLVGWGMDDLQGFLSLPARSGYAVVVMAIAVAIGYVALAAPEAIRGGPSQGERDKLVRRQSVVRVAVVLLLYGGLIFLPYADRHAIGVLNDGQLNRWAGLALFGVGIALVLWSGIALGRLYSPEVTVQEDHHLITDGPYRHVRHPRYLGGILYALGFSLVFRSWVGVAATVLSLGVFWLRIRDEEALMRREFGPAWETYCQRSWRLIPFVY
jgi:protein-S-isoprenylcysteine O-methyltransferase Ste14